MKLEESIKVLKAYINAIDTFGTIDYRCINNLYEPIKIALKALENKDNESHFIQSELDKANAEIIELKKMVDYMIDWIRKRSIYGVDSHEVLKEYFKKKARTSNE